MSEVEASLPNKEANLSEWFSLVLERAEIIDNRYGVKGFIVYRPYGMKIMKNIIKLFEEELERTGHKAVLFPLVIPESNLRKEAEHIRGFEGQVFWIEKAGFSQLEERIALRPTSETAIYPMYALWFKSYRDLPFKAYQTVTVYRYETKATRPLLRGREFLWIETHNVFATGEEAKEQTLEDAEIMRKVAYEKLGIPFLHLVREEFDKFAGAVETYAFDTLLADNRVLQIGTTHYLGTNFTRVFDVVIQDKEGKRVYPHSTCFGIGLSRILAAVILLHGDEFGLVLPFEIAPVQVVIIPIYKAGADNAGIRNYALEIESMFREKGITCVFDDSEKTPGEKFYYYDLRGVPFRIEVGPIEYQSKTVTIFRRDIRRRETVRLSELIEYVLTRSKDIIENLRARAEERLLNSIKVATTKDELMAHVAQKVPIIKVPFCGRIECANEIMNLTDYETRGRMLTDEGFKGKCIVCGSEGAHITVLAKAY